MALDTITLKEWGARLRVLRQLRRWTQADLEDTASIARGTVSHLERGKRECKLPIVLRLVAALGNADYLFGLTDAPGPAFGPVQYPEAS
jgi:transcriptional regulator with XRE-family HTH domain